MKGATGGATVAASPSLFLLFYLKDFPVSVFLQLIRSLAAAAPGLEIKKRYAQYKVIIGIYIKTVFLNCFNNVLLVC